MQYPVFLNNNAAEIIEVYRDLVIAAGGELNQAELNAHSALVNALIDANVWDKIKEFWTGRGSNLAAGLVKLKHPAGVQSSMTNVNFATGSYSRANGFQGGLGYLRSGFIPSAHLAGSTNMSLGCFVRATGSLGGLSTHYVGASNEMRISTVTASNSLYAGMGNAAYSLMNANGSDMLAVASNIPGSNGFLHKNGSTIVSQPAAAPRALPTQDIWVYNIRDVANNQRCSGRIRCYFVGDGFTEAEATKIFRAILNLNVELG